MKKVYQKPAALIQDMTVNCFVAGACSKAGSLVLDFSEDTCTYFDASSYMTFFSSQCEDGTGFGIDIVNPNKTSAFAQICYHRPADALSFFNS